MRVAVIGGGAAGFFAALSVKEHHPSADVFLLEKSNKLLSKVKVSGGGRCNVTHDCRSTAELAKHYPRGERFLKKAFKQFAVNDTVSWFEERGVELKTEEDGRMFPKTDRSQTVIDALGRAAEDAGISIQLGSPVHKLEPQQEGFLLSLRSSELQVNHIIIATGGSPKRSGLAWLEEHGQPVVDPVPSLFTFNLPIADICDLKGISVPNAVVWLEGAKWRSSGPLLITHWGLSGPAVLKASAIGARTLAERDYCDNVHINWVAGKTDEEVRSLMNSHLHSNKKITNTSIEQIPSRLWAYLLERSEISLEKTWTACGKKSLNRLVEVLTNDVYRMEGKTTFKEEFVTAGGIDLSGVNSNTMMSKHIPRLYFAGEVMDIDGFTGGFNFQAAWTTAWIAGRLA